jgi:Fic family protein
MNRFKYLYGYLTVMVFIRSKMIKGKEQKYLEGSIRLLDGKVKKISIYMKKDKTIKDLEVELRKKIENKLIECAQQYYGNDHIFDNILLSIIEKIKLNFIKISKTLSENQLNDVIDRFAVNFTYESNALEGNSLTLKDVTFVIKEGKAIKGRDLRDVFETINTKKAFELIFESKSKLNENNIMKLHEITVENTGVASGYKKFPNYLLGRKVKTTPPEKVKEEMKKLINWYDNNQDLHPLKLASLFHAKFEQIHPFEDGNGRVGRLLINLILLNKGYPPLIIRKSQRIKYFHALEAFDNGHEDLLIRFIIEKFKDTNDKFFKIYLKYL